MLKKSLCYYTADKGAGIIIAAGMKNLMNFALQINVKEREKERGGGGGGSAFIDSDKDDLCSLQNFFKNRPECPSSACYPVPLLPLPANQPPFCLQCYHTVEPFT